MRVKKSSKVNCHRAKNILKFSFLWKTGWSKNYTTGDPKRERGSTNRNETLHIDVSRHVFGSKIKWRIIKYLIGVQNSHLALCCVSWSTEHRRRCHNEYIHLSTWRNICCRKSCGTPTSTLVPYKENYQNDQTLSEYHQNKSN